MARHSIVPSRAELDLPLCEFLMILRCLVSCLRLIIVAYFQRLVKASGRVLLHLASPSFHAAVLLSGRRRSSVFLIARALLVEVPDL